MNGDHKQLSGNRPEQAATVTPGPTAQGREPRSTGMPTVDALRRKAGIREYTCGLCGEEFWSNCRPGDIRCTGDECEALLCPCCGAWFTDDGEAAVNPTAENHDNAAEIMRLRDERDRLTERVAGLRTELADAMGRLVAAERKPGSERDKYRGTIREALRIAVTAAENDRQAERFEAALAAMDREETRDA